MESPSSGQFGKPPPSASVPQVPLDGVANLDAEVIQVLQGNQDEMATRDLWVWTASQDFQAPKGKRVHQETSARGEPKGKMELQDLLGPPDHLGPEALLVTLGKTAPEELKAQRVPKENLDKMARWAPRDLQDPRGMMGCPTSQDSLDPQGPRVSQGMWVPKERMERTVPQD